eukprot:30872-Pelagococcus_subviridis.AAC.2
MSAHNTGDKNVSYNASLQPAPRGKTVPSRPLHFPKNTSFAVRASYDIYVFSSRSYVRRSNASGAALALSSKERLEKYGDVYSSVPSGVGSRGSDPSTGASTSLPRGE